jgi:hypothetical protein
LTYRSGLWGTLQVSFLHNLEIILSPITSIWIARLKGIRDLVKVKRRESSSITKIIR